MEEMQNSYAGLISIHAAREGGDGVPHEDLQKPGISIHAAREGGDAVGFYFYMIHGISIHAAREGGDKHSESDCKPAQHFNPRRP